MITERQADLVRRFIAPFMERDPHADPASGRYEISSVYLDTERFRLCQETLEGFLDRYKLRIRAYSDLPSDPVFFEVKRRLDRKIAKDRARVRRSQMFRMLQTGDAPSDCGSEAEMAQCNSFVTLMRSIGATPKVLVRYEREAYRGSFDASVRVTFDRRLQAAISTRPTCFFDATGWRPVETNSVILELKFNGSYPAWVSDIVRLAQLRRTSYSKYANSVGVCFQDGVASAHFP